MNGRKPSVAQIELLRDIASGDVQWWSGTGGHGGRTLRPATGARVSTATLAALERNGWVVPLTFGQRLQGGILTRRLTTEGQRALAESTGSAQ